MTNKNDRFRYYCKSILVELVGYDLVEKWWNSPNTAFNGDTPENKFQTDPTLVYDYLSRSMSGDY